jgi:DNA-binding LytR/AlgR family response regulator
MLNTIIIEDERPSRESLLQTLARISADVNLLATITSVQEGISYLGQPRNADIIFSDVQLPDGLSFRDLPALRSRVAGNFRYGL